MIPDLFINIFEIILYEATIYSCSIVYKASLMTGIIHFSATKQKNISQVTRITMVNVQGGT